MSNLAAVAPPQLAAVQALSGVMTNPASSGREETVKILQQLQSPGRGSLV